MTEITTQKDTAMTEPRITNPLEPTAPTDPDTKTDVFSGFRVTIEKLTDTFLRVYPMPEDDDPNDFSLQYGMEGASLIEVDGPFFDRRSIRLRIYQNSNTVIHTNYVSYNGTILCSKSDTAQSSCFTNTFE